eukprot:5937013-Amphidinium_carterae.2
MHQRERRERERVSGQWERQTLMSLGTAQLLDTRALTKPPRFSGNDEDWNEWSFQFLGYVGLVSQATHT